MRKILNGLRYDTDKADLIGEASYGNGGDFRHFRAGLYKTPRAGRYFLAGEGGPMSRFAQSTGLNEWSGGEDIIPLDEEDAREWAEQYLDAEEIERGFPESIEDA